MSNGVQPPAISVLVVSDCDLTARALGSVLASQGYVVDRARTGDRALAAMRAGRPSAVIVDAMMTGVPGVEVCRALRADAPSAGTTPVILVNGDGVRRSDRLAAYGAGAWEVCPRPLDGELLLLKLQTFVQAQRLHDRARASAFIDGETGIYSLAGLMARARELQALAARRREPLACVAFLVEPRAGLLPALDVGTPSARDIARTARARLRASDLLGRTGRMEFAVLAPETDADGAQRLAARLQASFDEVITLWGGTACPLRVTCCVITDCAKPGVSAAETLAHTSRALHDGPSDAAPAHGIPAPVVFRTSIGMPLLG